MSLFGLIRQDISKDKMQIKVMEKNTEIIVSAKTDK